MKSTILSILIVTLMALLLLFIVYVSDEVRILKSELTVILIETETAAEETSETVTEADTEAETEMETIADKINVPADDTYLEPPTEEICLGTFKLTAYCACPQCSDGYGACTALGTPCIAGRTIAVDPSIIPYGTEVEINGHTYTAEDCGGAIKGNRIDIYFDSHAEALEFGVQYSNVFTLT